MNKVFEIPEVNPLSIEMKTEPDESNKFSLTPLFNEYRLIRDEIKEKQEKDDEIKFLRNYLYGEFTGRLNKATVMEQLFVKKELKKGLYVYYEKDAKSAKKLNLIPIQKDSIFSHRAKLDFINFSMYPNYNDYKSSSEKTSRIEENLRHLRETCPNCLKIGGTVIFVPSYSYESLCFPFLCKIFFERVIVYSTLQMICVGYNGVTLKDKGLPYINSKIIKDYHDFIEESIKKTMSINKLILRKDKDPFFDLLELKTLNAKRILHEQLSLKEYNMFYDYFSNNKTENLKDFDDYSIFEIIHKNNYKKVLQVGLNDGICTAYLLKALKENKGILYSIDSYQTLKFENQGIDFIKRLKYDSNLLFVNDKIHYKYLQSLSKEDKEEQSFDLIVINNMENYQTILLEIYFSYKLLKKDGLLIVQNIIAPDIHNAVSYIDLEWYFYEKQHTNSFLYVIYKKIEAKVV
jgi:hypothetical protein